MSNTAIEFRAPAVARSTAQRVADGVVASYILALASVSTEPTEAREPQPSRAHDCDQSRAGRPGRVGAPAARRHPARRRALLPA
jgi:hypothetical protein